MAGAGAGSGHLFSIPWIISGWRSGATGAGFLIQTPRQLYTLPRHVGNLFGWRPGASGAGFLIQTPRRYKPCHIMLGNPPAPAPAAPRRQPRQPEVGDVKVYIYTITTNDYYYVVL